LATRRRTAPTPSRVRPAAVVHVGGVAAGCGTPGRAGRWQQRQHAVSGHRELGTANGTAVQSYVCTGDWNQVWQRQTDGRNALKNPQSGKCLGVAGAGTANASLVQLWTCTGASNQAWLRQPDGSLQNVGSGRCLEMNDYDTTPNGQMQNGDCVDGGGYFNQTWMPTSTGALQSVQATRCLDVTGGGTPARRRGPNSVQRGGIGAGVTSAAVRHVELGRSGSPAASRPSAAGSAPCERPRRTRRP
jgi:hypothetical protein